MKPYSRQLLTTAFSFTLVASTAVFALVLEDWLPTSHTSRFLGTTWQRLGLALVFALLLWCFARRISENGTLYYFRVLDERAPDLHEKAHERARTRFLDCRTVTRTLTLGVEAWVDISDIVEQSRRDLERAADSDAITTSHEFAPNAHWPIEFAIGYEWPLPEGTKIVEFNTDDLGPVTATAAIGNPGRIEPVPRSERDESAKLVWVDIHLTKEKPAQNGDQARRDNSQFIFHRYPDATALWGWPNADNGGCYRDSADLRPAVNLGSGQVHAAAELVARAILLALNAYPNALVAVGARTPKTVAVLSGRYFAAYLQQRPGTPPTDDSTAQYQSWSDPWRRLILLSYNQSIRQWQALKVRRNQPYERYFEPQQHDIHEVNPSASGELINLTPHDVNLFTTELVIPRYGVPARVLDVPTSMQMMLHRNDEIPILDVAGPGNIKDLPEPSEGKIYIVSRVTALASPERSDLVFPMYELRDSDGGIVGCRALGRCHNPRADS